jgi:hypothetical protein
MAVSRFAHAIDKSVIDDRDCRSETRLDEVGQIGNGKSASLQQYFGKKIGFVGPTPSDPAGPCAFKYAKGFGSQELLRLIKHQGFPTLQALPFVCPLWLFSTGMQGKLLVSWARASDEDIDETTSSFLPAGFVSGVKDANEGTEEVVGIGVVAEIAAGDGALGEGGE